MTKFEFLNTELTEAKLFRNPGSIKTIPLSHMADAFFNAILSLELLYHINPDAAQRYAKATFAYGNLEGWRTGGTDLHNMVHMMKNPSKFSNKLQLDRIIHVPALQLTTWIRNLANGRRDETVTRRFLLSLQNGLAVKNTSLRACRRLLADWERTTPNEQQLVGTRLYIGLQHDLSQSDMWNSFSKNIKREKLLLKDIKQPKLGLPLWKKMAAAGVLGKIS